MGNKEKTYFSYYSYFDDNLRVFQLAYRSDKIKLKNFNFGFVSREIIDNYNTQSAQNNNLIPDYDNIDYSSIYKFKDREIGFIISYNKEISNYWLNMKIKPIVHSVDKYNAYGVNFDFHIGRKFQNTSFSLGLLDFQYKKWKNGKTENNHIVPVLAASIKYKSVLSIINIKEYNSKVAFEINMLQNLFFRLGFKESSKATYGLGIKLNLIELDYTNYKLDDLSENVNQISLTFNLDNWNETFR